jgi:hypothetical protein
LREERVENHFHWIWQISDQKAGELQWDKGTLSRMRQSCELFSDQKSLNLQHKWSN